MPQIFSNHSLNHSNETPKTLVTNKKCTAFTEKKWGPGRLFLFLSNTAVHSCVNKFFWLLMYTFLSAVLTFSGYKQTNRQTDTQTDRQTDRQAKYIFRLYEMVPTVFFSGLHKLWRYHVLAHKFGEVYCSSCNTCILGHHYQVIEPVSWVTIIR